MTSISFLQEVLAAYCANGVEVERAEQCNFFVKRSDPATAKVDDRISELIPAHDALDPPVRSFALVVSVHSYPVFKDPKYKDLPPAQADRDNLVEFLDKNQKFDESSFLLMETQRKTISFFPGHLSQQRGQQV